MMKFSKVMIPTLATLALGMSLISTPASGTTADTKLNQSITGGEHNIAVTPVSNFNAVTLSGETQVTHANPGVLTVTDATGSGNGWRINVKADQFKVSGGDAKSNRTLPKGSLVLNSGVSYITKVGGTSSPNPEFKTTNFIIDTDNQVTILSGKKDEGMGKYNVSFNDKSLALTLNPHSTYVENKAGATSYESKLTYSIVTGP
jgi:hypothetical protein